MWLKELSVTATSERFNGSVATEEETFFLAGGSEPKQKKGEHKWVENRRKFTSKKIPYRVLKYLLRNV